MFHALGTLPLSVGNAVRRRVVEAAAGLVLARIVARSIRASHDPALYDRAGHRSGSSA